MMFKLKDFCSIRKGFGILNVGWVENRDTHEEYVFFHNVTKDDFWILQKVNSLDHQMFKEMVETEIYWNNNIFDFANFNKSYINGLTRNRTLKDEFKIDEGDVIDDEYLKKLKNENERYEWDEKLSFDIFYELKQFYFENKNKMLLKQLAIEYMDIITNKLNNTHESSRNFFNWYIEEMEQYVLINFGNLYKLKFYFNLDWDKLTV